MCDILVENYFGGDVMAFPMRKRVCLKGYDYNTPGYYYNMHQRKTEAAV